MEKILEVVFTVKTCGQWNRRDLAITAGIDRIKLYRHAANLASHENLDLTAKDVLPFDVFAENMNKTETAQTEEDSRQRAVPQGENNYTVARALLGAQAGTRMMTKVMRQLSNNISRGSSTTSQKETQQDQEIQRSRHSTTFSDTAESN